MPFTYNVFIDFDGTITEIDVGYELFKRFTNSATEPLVQRYRAGELNSLECLSGECEIWNSCQPAPSEVDKFLENQPIRQGFNEFIAYLQSIGIGPIILSEGFDFYIDRFLGHHGLLNMPKITNSAVYIDGKVTPKFPYYEAGCRSCSNCKGYHINRMRHPKSCAIFIGDGHSDLHGSRSADIVFARSFLAENMAQSGRAFLPFEDFADVESKIKEIMAEHIFSFGERIVLKYISPQYHKSIEDLWECGEVMKHVGYPSGVGWTRDQYEKQFEEMSKRDDSVFLAIENDSGEFLGEAKISFPNEQGFCHHELKLLPRYWDESINRKAWNLILDRADARWPNARTIITPTAEDEKDINLFLKLGFRFDGSIETWEPTENVPGVVPVRYRKMVRDCK
jgi:2,3-diketo-5-methylthio-1-phosphopentane phosphatase